MDHILLNVLLIIRRVMKPRKRLQNKSEWNDEERIRAHYDCNAKIITSSLSMDEFFRVYQCKNAKEIWDVLEVTHE